MNSEQLGYEPDQMGDWLVLKVGQHTYITDMKETVGSCERAWREIYESLLMLPVDDLPQAVVYEQKDRTCEQALSLPPNGSSWVAAEILYMMDRYQQAVPNKRFINTDFIHYRNYAQQHNLLEGLKPAAVYRCAVCQGSSGCVGSAGGFWQLLDESGKVTQTADKVWDLVPTLGTEQATASRLEYRIPGVSEPWVRTTTTELQFLQAFQAAQPIQSAEWFDSLVNNQALDAFIASHYGAYQAFSLVQGLPILVRDELDELVYEAQRELGTRGCEPNLVGYKQALLDGATSGVEQQLALMRQYGIPGEQEFVHALGDPANRHLVSQEYLDRHRVDILIAQPIGVAPEQQIRADIFALHEAAVLRPELLYTPLIKQSDLNSVYFWMPLKDFDQQDWINISHLIPESLFKEPRFQLEALAVGLFSEKELQKYLIPQLQGVSKSRTEYTRLSMAERLSEAQRYWADVKVIDDPRNIVFVPDEARTPIQVEQLLLRDWTHLGEISPALLDKTVWTEEMVLSGLRRQKGLFRYRESLERLFESLPERYHTPRVKQAMAVALERFGKVAEQKTQEQVVQRSSRMKR